MRGARTALAGLVLGLAGGAVACGDDPSACEVWGEEVCAVACDCADGDGCAFEAGAVTVSFDDEKDCNGFFSTAFACRDGGDPEFDYAACTERLDEAMCVDDDDGGHAELPDCADE